MKKINKYGLTFYKINTVENTDKAFLIAQELVEELFYLLTGKSKMNYPDLMLCWKIPSSILKQGDEYGCETYPGLWTVAKIYPPLVHAGAAQ